MKTTTPRRRDGAELSPVFDAIEGQLATISRVVKALGRDAALSRLANVRDKLREIRADLAA